MSDCYSAPINLTSAWTDLTVTYGAMSGVASWVQNLGPGAIRVAYTSSGSAPAGDIGELLQVGDELQRTAAHVWAKSLFSGGASCNVGLQ